MNLYIVGMMVVYKKPIGTNMCMVGIPQRVSWARAGTLNELKGLRDHVLPYK